MSKPEMQRLAEEGVFQIECAMTHHKYMRGIVTILKERMEKEPGLEHYVNLARLAIDNLGDWHNCLDCSREDLGQKIAEASRARVSVREVSE